MAKNLVTEHVTRSRFTTPERKNTTSGEKLHKTYAIELDENGHKEVVETGYTNMYAKIQEATAECEISNILAMVMQGDSTALNRAQAAYLDVTDMPKTLAEAQNAMIKLKNEFNALPLEVRKEFNYSPEEYVNAYGSEEWKKAMGLNKEEKVINNPALEVVEKELKLDE